MPGTVGKGWVLGSESVYDSQTSGDPAFSILKGFCLRSREKHANGQEPCRSPLICKVVTTAGWCSGGSELDGEAWSGPWWWKVVSTEVVLALALG